MVTDCVPATQTTTGKNYKQRKMETVNATLAILRELFPTIFNESRQPMAIGIHDKILEQVDGAITELGSTPLLAPLLTLGRPLSRPPGRPGGPPPLPLSRASPVPLGVSPGAGSPQLLRLWHSSAFLRVRRGLHVPLGCEEVATCRS